EVSFDIDANGILNVSAKDTATGKEQSIEIKGSSGLSEDEINKMTKEAEQHAEDDKKRRYLIDQKNQADQLVYTTENVLKEHGEKVPAQERSNVESALNSLKEAAKGDDAEAIRRAMENVSTASQALGKIMYEQAAKQHQAAAAAGGTQAGAGKDDKKKDDDVIDAEYEVKE
ncbi:MAG: Hsp70 family protein, partial [Sedimentisphaerales bacterium]|nr:Hsp70 family protein [Sedimentisphaerales bacterium]